MKFFISISFVILFNLITLCHIFEAFFYGYHWLSKKHHAHIDDNDLCRKYLGNILGAWAHATLVVFLIVKAF